MKKKRINPFPLRMEDELRLKAEKAARHDRRSLNTWLLIAVEEKLKSEEQEVAA